MLARLYVKEALQEGAELVLDEENSHYLTRVLRLSRESKIEVFNGDGSAYEAVMQGEDKRAVVLRISSCQKSSQAIVPQGLAVAVCAPQKMSWILQKATELGVGDIWVLETAFSQNQPSNLEQFADKKARYDKILVQACQQSGVNQLPHLHGCIALESWLQQDWTEYSVMLADPGGPRVRDLAAPAKPLVWLVGPEGGWHDDERKACQKIAQRVSISPSILRMETACVAVLTLGHNWVG